MKLSEVLKYGNKFARPKDLPYEWYGYYQAGTGPHADLHCDYIMFHQINASHLDEMSTSLDLYPEDILAEDWEII